MRPPHGRLCGPQCCKPLLPPRGATRFAQATEPAGADQGGDPRVLVPTPRPTVLWGRGEESCQGSAGDVPGSAPEAADTGACCHHGE